MVISRTPLRMSFAGGGSDFKEYYQKRYGCVVSTAINKYIYVAVNRKFDDLIRVSYSKTETTDRVDAIEHNLVREALKKVGIKKGVDISYMSDMLPNHEGTGLGASSTLTVGILNALYTFIGKRVTPEQLAREACEIEIDILAHPMGKQDHYPAAYGGLNRIQFNPDETVEVTPIPCKKELKELLNENLLLFYTGLASASKNILPQQQKNISTTSEVLDQMVKLAQELQKSLAAGDVMCFGRILHEGWLLKQRLANNISNGKINTWYEKARQGGAIGGKILGSGGGGFLLLYCEKKHHPNVRKALADLRETKFLFDDEGSKIVYEE